MTHDTEHRGNPLSKNLVNLVRRLHRKGNSIRGIKRITGLANATIQKYIKGLPPHRPARPPRPPRKQPAGFESIHFEPFEDEVHGDDKAEIDRLLDDCD